MAGAVRRLFVAALFIISVCSIFGEIPLRRFEYKYSFKPPYLAQRDGSVPFWEYGGSKFNTFLLILYQMAYAIASAENVRIAPSLKSQKGRLNE
ncbi:hypothetical protein PR048_030626 [Dryococelus australis]|uniref:L-type lectin-like domain-containing protein n=1 Tax=Dryococelus australis TaxID=614101 RepID=A0ABQ9G9G6_9NEOP|nr:hypothetical protein PR048_030626 [Dryococelus australis]